MVCSSFTRNATLAFARHSLSPTKGRRPAGGKPTINICSVSFVLTLISFRRCGNTFHMHSDPSFPVVPSPKRHADPVNALFTASFLIGLCHVSNRTFHPS